MLKSLLSSSASSGRVWTRHTTALRGEALHSHIVSAPLPVAPNGCRPLELTLMIKTQEEAVKLLGNAHNTLNCMALKRETEM